MALNFLLKRSATASKRPVAASMALGELDLNYDSTTGGLYYKDSASVVVKVGPIQVSSAAPNSTPGGSAGNSRGEGWLDTSANIFKIYNGTTWQNAVPAGTTSVAGIVQLTDSTSSTSTTTAATPNSVKTAYDLAAAAIAKSVVTAKGDLIAGTAASTVTALAVGSDGQVLVACSACTTGLTWTASGGSGTVTCIETGAGLTGGPITTTGSISLNTACVVQPTAYTAKGTILGASAASTPAALAVGSDGQVLVACASCTTGLTWGTAAAPADATPSVAGVVLGLTDAGNYNTALGGSALSSLTSGLGNTAIGTFAGTGITCGGNNTVIGISGGSSIGCGNLNLVLGNGVDVPVADGSCQLAIGWGMSDYWLTGNSTKAIKPAAGIIDCANSCGTAGQVLMSNGANAVCWGAAGGALCGFTCTATPFTVALGSGAGVAVTCGVGNIAIGYNALDLETTGGCNIAIGINALGTSNGGISNVAVGPSAGFAITTGTRNTLFGQTSGSGLTTGGNNIFLGFQAGTGTTTGEYNVVVGNNSGTLGTGGCNVILGRYSFSAGTNPSNQFIVGQNGNATLTCFKLRINECQALSFPADATGGGSPNYGTSGQVLTSQGSTLPPIWCAAPAGPAATSTSAGSVVGCTPSTACGSVFLGCCSGGNPAGANTAIGVLAGAALNTGAQNVFVGWCAGRATTATSSNVAIGALSMCCASPGSSIAIGSQTLQCSTGTGNTAIGHQAGFSLTTGNYNTLLGTGIGGVTTGDGNLIVMARSNTGLATPTFNVTTECNRVVVGGACATNAYVQVAWTVVSDGRDKTNVTALPVGLGLVKELNPVSYQFKESRDSDVPYGPVRYGFIAQEVLAAEGEDPVLVDNEDPEHLRMVNDHLNAVLVNAVKELAAKNEELEARIAALENPN